MVEGAVGGAADGAVVEVAGVGVEDVQAVMIIDGTENPAARKKPILEPPHLNLRKILHRLETRERERWNQMADTIVV